MGRHRNLYSVSKKDFKNFNFTLDANLGSDERYDDLYERFGEVFKQEFEIGKFLNFDNIPKTEIDLGDMYIITEEMIKNFIKEYYVHIIKYYKDIFEEKDEKLQDYYMLEHFKRKIFDLENWDKSICLDKDKGRLTNNWRFETDVFDIIRMYKTFDFENNMLICLYS